MTQGSRAATRPDQPEGAGLDAGPADLPPGTTALREAGGRAVLVAHAAGQWFAAGALCPHAGLPMEGARVRGGDVICPHHGARFCLASGRHRGPPATRGLEVFRAVEAGGRIRVFLP
ncbi:Rieske (2Fe-2S) protein [Thermaurantiacus sp.]